MKREYLKGLGLEAETIDKIMSEHGKTVAAKDAKIELMESEKAELAENLKQRDADLKDLTKKAAGNEDLKKQLDEMTSNYKTAKEEADARVAEIQKSSAIKLALANKVHDVDIVTSQLNLDKITVDGDEVKGLDEQVTALQESKGFLFVESTEPQEPNTPSITGPGAPLAAANKDSGADLDFGSVLLGKGE